MSRKTIALLTLQNSNNYGAMYQAYALSKYLQKSGHEVVILDYEMTRDNASIIGYLEHPLALLLKLFYRRDLVKSKIVRKKSTLTNTDRNKAFSRIFNTFRCEHLNITEIKYNYQKLTKTPPKADIFICGSDQVWAADFLFTSPAFLLGFAPKNSKKISYAASFGKTKLEPYLKREFRKHISKFDSISVREKSGIDIVANSSNRDAVHVLDPTLLLNKKDYEDIIDYSMVPQSPYILVYKLYQDQRLSDWMDSCINSIRDIQNLPVLAVSTNSSFSPNNQWKEVVPTPGQLLGLIEKSASTMTNSFHGTVFSILLKTKFLTFARDEYKNKQNPRMEEMLDNLGLSEYYCPPFSNNDNITEKLSYSGNFEKAEEKLNTLKVISINFLDQATQ